MGGISYELNFREGGNLIQPLARFEKVKIQILGSLTRKQMTKHLKPANRKLYIAFMKMIISILFGVLFCANSFAQKEKVDFMAFGNNAYYTILEKNNDVLLVKYYLDNSRLKRDSLIYTSLDSAKNELNFESLIKANRLQKEKAFSKKKFPYLSNLQTNFGELANKENAAKFSKFNRVASLDFPSKKDTLFSIKFYENGDKSLW